MQKPKVSILIPFKNTEAYLSECLTSIVNQTHEDWEVIAVNDHSMDTSLAIADDFAKKDKRFTILTNTGKGIIKALRLAYSHASGSFITRMDADDVMTPNRLAVMLNSLLENGSGHLAVGQVKYFADSGVNNGYERYEKWLNRLTAKGNNYQEIYKECVIPSPCWMLHREDLDAVNAFNANTYPEDYDLAFRFYEKKLKCIPCDSVLHYWRDYAVRTSRTSEHYAENSFLDLKLHYFLKLDYASENTLVVWGAGAKGKDIAKKLIEKNIEFYWLCDNPRKIGKDIYGQILFHFNQLEQLKNPQTIVTVANKEAQETIRTYLKTQNQVEMRNYFFFC